MKANNKLETLEEKIQRVVKEHVDIASYDPKWPQLFEEEKRHLIDCLPDSLLGRIEHFGSTAVPGLPAKPIIDMLVEVRSLEEARETVPPILEPQGYDYFWRPIGSEVRPPFYCWFIKRDAEGNRTHHIHMIDAGFGLWDRLLFRDILILRPDLAQEYADLKTRLAGEHPDDRIKYTQQKGDFVRRVTEMAKEFFQK